METRTVYASGLRIARMTGSGSSWTTYYYHGDALGSTWRMTDASRNVVFATSYDPFGRTWGTSGSLASSERYRFAGERNDTESGFVYLRARQYDPAVGRFTSTDPVLGTLGMPQTLNRYPYAVNDPTRYTDPTGEIAPLVVLGILLLAGAIGGGASTGYYLATTPQERWTWQGGLTAFGAGFAGGAAFAALTIATGGGFAASVLAGAASGAIGYSAERGIEYGLTGSLEWDWRDFGLSVGLGAVLGAATYGAGRLYARWRLNNAAYGGSEPLSTKFYKPGHGQTLRFASPGDYEQGMRDFAFRGLTKAGRGPWRVFADRGDLIVYNGKAMVVYNPEGNFFRSMYAISTPKVGWQPATTWYQFFGWP